MKGKRQKTNSSFILFFNPHPRMHYLIPERQRERKVGDGRKERETDRHRFESNINWLPHTRPNGDRTHSLGMCPDWGLNPQAFSL